MNPIEEKMRQTIEERQGKDRAKVLEELKKVPIVQYACSHAGISRATYYRWMQESPEFERETEIAIAEGIEVINDMSESQIMKMIREGKFPAVRYWLDHHKDKYRRLKPADPPKQPIKVIMDF